MNNHENLIDHLTAQLHNRFADFSPVVSNAYIAEYVINAIGQNSPTFTYWARDITPLQKLTNLYSPELEHRHKKEKLLDYLADNLFDKINPRPDLPIEMCPSFDKLADNEKNDYREIVMMGARLLKNKYYPLDDITIPGLLNNDKVINKINEELNLRYGEISPNRSNQDMAIASFNIAKSFYSYESGEGLIKPVEFLNKPANQDKYSAVVNEMANELYKYSRGNLNPESDPANYENPVPPLERLPENEQLKFRDIVTTAVAFSKQNTFLSKIKNLRHTFITNVSIPHDPNDIFKHKK